MVINNGDSQPVKAANVWLMMKGGWAETKIAAYSLNLTKTKQTNIQPKHYYFYFQSPTAFCTIR